MSDVVVDSSVVVKLVLPESDSEQAVRFVNTVVGRGERLHVLDLALLESANAIWKRRHRGLISLPEARRFASEISAIPVQTQPANKLLAAATEIAFMYDRSIYGALFIALVQEMRLPGVTSDEPLWRSVRTDFPDVWLLRDWP
jgi:predicted nucleic acid-binding protein